MPEEAGSRASEFIATWARSFSEVLNQVGLPTAQAETLDSSATANAMAQVGDKKYWAAFQAGKHARGALAILVSEPDAVQFAQALMSEPANREAEFTEAYRDAAAELMRQAAGRAALLWAGKAGGEVEFAHVGANPPSFEPAAQGAIQIKAENFPAATVFLLLSAELLASPEPQAVAPAAPASPVEAQSALASALGQTPGNLELLLDVKLEATIRFGQRQLLLREILSLSPGSVVELDRQINEPAELLVAGRLVARGEVVVVDGNFGLRIRQLSSPRERAELSQA